MVCDVLNTVVSLSRLLYGQHIIVLCTSEHSLSFEIRKKIFSKFYNSFWFSYFFSKYALENSFVFYTFLNLGIMK